MVNTHWKHLNAEITITKPEVGFACTLSSKEHDYWTQGTWIDAYRATSEPMLLYMLSLQSLKVKTHFLLIRRIPHLSRDVIDPDFQVTQVVPSTRQINAYQLANGNPESRVIMLVLLGMIALHSPCLAKSMQVAYTSCCVKLWCFN